MLPNWQKVFARRLTKWRLRGAEQTSHEVRRGGLKTKNTCSGPIRVGLTATIVSIAWLCCPTTTLAYRPFDGTDASVADLGEFETEFQPAGALWEGSQTTLIAPDLVFNFGFKENW